MENIAAIDIGSNAIRLIIAEADGDFLKPLKRFRAPLRLGKEAFDTKSFSEKTIKQTVALFLQFKSILESHNVTKYRAVATSATREAKNGKTLVAQIRKETGIVVERIDGIEEAKLIHLAASKKINLSQKRALLIDVGGGSVEVSFCENDFLSATQSFPLGTVRLLNELKKRKLSEADLKILIGEAIPSLSHYMESHTSHAMPQFAIGTGGNLDTLRSLKPLLLQKPVSKMLTYNELSEMTQLLQALPLKSRIDILKLRPDRADVIIPAALVVKTILRQSGCDTLYIPNVGLREGLLLGMRHLSA